jgi:hypothetical protein
MASFSVIEPRHRARKPGHPKIAIVVDGAQAIAVAVDTSRQRS